MDFTILFLSFSNPSLSQRLIHSSTLAWYCWLWERFQSWNWFLFLFFFLNLCQLERVFFFFLQSTDTYKVFWTLPFSGNVLGLRDFFFFYVSGKTCSPLMSRWVAIKLLNSSSLTSCSSLDHPSSTQISSMLHRYCLTITGTACFPCWCVCCCVCESFLEAVYQN